MKAILAAVLFSFAGVEIAQACSCVQPPPVPEKRENASAVFVGRMVEVTPERDRQKTYTFAVSETFKGAIEGTVTVKSYADGAMCGSNFQQGVSYLVYADGAIDQLSTNLCNANQHALSPQGEAEIAALRSLSAEDK